MRRGWGWLVPIAALAAVTLLTLADPPALRLLRNAAFDQYQRWQPRVPTTMPVRIVDIDDESLRRLGQWPWPRTRVAELVAILERARPASIALDIVLAEPDRTSPSALLQGAAVPPATAHYLKSLPNHDEVLAGTLAHSNVAIGFALTHEVNESVPIDGVPAPSLVDKARFVTIGDSPLPFLPTFASSVPSLMALQQAAAGQGALTFVPDADGVVRRVPLLASLDGRLVPSLTAEALRLAQGERNYTVRTAANAGGLTDVRIGQLQVNTNAQGAMWVHYSRPIAARYLPAWQVLAGAIPAAELQGRIVLVGTSAQGLMDLRFSALGGVVPGVEVHAQALEQVLTHQQLVRPGWAPAVEVLAIVLGGLAIGAVAMLRGAAFSAASLVALASLTGLAGWQAFSRLGLLIDPATPTLAWAFVFVPTTVLRHMLSERRQRWVRQAFARYVSPNLVDYLIDHPGALELGGKRQRCSFVFADVAGFTSIMETMEPGTAVGVLNDYLDRMIAIAFEHEGTLDRIVGDSVAIVFSAPIEQIDHESRALRCALAMHRFAEGYVTELAKRGIPFGKTRIGVHTGEVTVGNFGGSTIFDYRALGDPVNIASRLEGANKHLGTLVCVSQATLDGCPDAQVRPIGRLRLVGRVQPVMAYEPRSPDAQGESVGIEYVAAFRLMTEGRAEALAAFESIHRRRPDDPLVELHWRRLKSGAEGDLIELADK